MCFEDLQTVSMNEDLSHGVAVDVDVLDLLGSDVLALSQLKDVLLPVDDLQRAVLRHTEDMLKEVFLHARKRLNTVLTSNLTNTLIVFTNHICGQT